MGMHSSFSVLFNVNVSVFVPKKTVITKKIYIQKLINFKTIT